LSSWCCTKMNSRHIVRWISSCIGILFISVLGLITKAPEAGSAKLHAWRPKLYQIYTTEGKVRGVRSSLNSIFIWCEQTGHYHVLLLLRGIILFFLPRIIEKQSARLGEIWPHAVRDIAKVELNKTLRTVEQACNLSDMFSLFVGGNPHCDPLLPRNHWFIRALVLHDCGTAWCLCISLETPHRICIVFLLQYTK
jgi:hypothetical protein